MAARRRPRGGRPEGVTRGAYRSAMFVALLIAANIPIYLLIGWVIFDSKDNAAESFWDAIVQVLKRAFIPPILRYMIWEGEDEHDVGSVFQMVGFFIACIAVTYGEWYLLTTYVWPELAA